jgi:hypothetical protein
MTNVMIKVKRTARGASLSAVAVVALPRPVRLSSANWVSSSTNNTGREVWFYDHPDGAACATLVHEAAPHSRGPLTGAADNTTGIIVRTEPGASRVMPCPEARRAPSVR